MEFLPLFFSLKQRSVLIVGGGEVALRKARLLTKAGACINVVSPQIRDDLKELVLNSGGALSEEQYQSKALEKVMLVVAATDNQAVNKQVYNDAQQQNLPVNVVDQPDLCSFIFPAIVDRSPVIAAVSSVIKRVCKPASLSATISPIPFPLLAVP